MALIQELWAKLRTKTREGIAACGFGFAGFYSLANRKILHSPNYPALDGFKLAPALGKFLDVPFTVDNDANMAAYGEYMHGAGRGAQSLVLLTVGTGIGSGVILDGELWHGKCGFAGELGHITVNPEGEPCNCGNRGCLEREASAPKIVKNYREFAGTKKELTAKDVYLLAKAGDLAARRAFDRCGYYLGIGLGIVINLLNPEKILLGGGVMTTGEYLMAPALEEAGKRALRVSLDCCRIERAVLGNDAGLVGAAAWARTRAGRARKKR